MERSRTQGSAHNRRKSIRMMTFATCFGALLIAMGSFATIGLAQTNLLPETDSRGTSPARQDPQPIETQGRMQAPIGHRQPRVQDLPPSVLRKESGEGRGFNAEMELDQKLGICKGC
jgi:hypothetical protein